MAKVVCWLTVLVSIAMVATSSAALPDEEVKRAERLYETGDFMAAARIAESAPSARGQTLAAQATLAAADYAATPLEAFFDGCADEGRRLIDRAMTLEPGNPVLRFVYVQALVRLGG